MSSKPCKWQDVREWRKKPSQSHKAMWRAAKQNTSKEQAFSQTGIQTLERGSQTKLTEQFSWTGMNWRNNNKTSKQEALATQHKISMRNLGLSCSPWSITAGFSNQGILVLPQLLRKLLSALTRHPFQKSSQLSAFFNYITYEWHYVLPPSPLNRQTVYLLLIALPWLRKTELNQFS